MSVCPFVCLSIRQAKNQKKLSILKILSVKYIDFGIIRSGFYVVPTQGALRLLGVSGPKVSHTSEKSESLVFIKIWSVGTRLIRYSSQNTFLGMRGRSKITIFDF